MNYNVTDIVFDFDDDEANTVCNSDLETFFIASESVRREVVEENLGVWAVSYTHLTLPTT